MSDMERQLIDRINKLEARLGELNRREYTSGGVVSVRTGSMAANAVVSIGADTFRGTLLVSSDSAGSALIEMVNATTLKLMVNGADHNYSITKDTASHVNMYIESNMIKVQNKTAGAVVVVGTLFDGRLV